MKMTFGFTTRAALTAICCASAAVATAAPMIDVEVYNYPALNNVASNATYIASHTPNQQFKLTSLPSIVGNNLNDPITVFGTAVVAGSVQTFGTADPSFENTLYRFTGFLDLGTADQLFKIVANDGFRLTIGGSTILTSDTQGTKTHTTSVAAGPQAFELIYWNNANAGSLALTIDGTNIAPVNGPVSASSVPLPGSLPLLAAGLGAMAWRRRGRVAG
jgi:hypothetical protein